MYTYISLFDMITIFAPVVILAIVGLIAARNMKKKQIHQVTFSFAASVR